MFIKFTNNIIAISPITFILNLNYEFKKKFQSQDISPLNILDPKYHVKRQVNRSKFNHAERRASNTGEHERASGTSGGPTQCSLHV